MQHEWNLKSFELFSMKVIVFIDTEVRVDERPLYELERALR